MFDILCKKLKIETHYQLLIIKIYYHPNYLNLILIKILKYKEAQQLILISIIKSHSYKIIMIINPYWKDMAQV